MNALLRYGLLLVCCLPATASAWRYLEPRPPLQAYPNGFATTADGGLLFSSADGVRRVNASGTTTAFLAGPVDGLERGYLFPLPDGSVLLADWQFGCGVSRLDGTLRRRWSEYTFGCWLENNAAGDAWLNHEAKLQRLTDDGRIAATVPATALGGTAIHAFAVTADGGVLAASNATADGGDTTVARFERNGTRRWAWTTKEAAVRSLQVEADGSIVVRGIKPRAPVSFGNGELYVGMLDANGTPRWSYVLPGTDYNPQRVAPTGANAAYVLATFPSRPTKLLRIENGALKWEREVCVTLNVISPYLTALPNGEALLVCRHGDVARFQRYDAARTMTADVALPLAEVLQMSALADGRFLLLGYEPGVFTGRTRMIAVNGNGAVVDTPFSRLQASEPLNVVNQHFAPDGSTYLVSQASGASSTQYSISKVDANGRGVWSTAVGVPIEPGSQLSLGGGTLCLTAARKEPRDFGPVQVTHLIECVNAADGTRRWTQTLTDPSGRVQNFSRVLEDGTLIFVHSTDGMYEFLRYDAAGVVTARTRGTGIVKTASINAQGQTSVTFDESGAARLVQFDAQGTRRFEATGPSTFDGVSVVAASTGADGSVVAIGRFAGTGNRSALWSVAPDGTTRWTREIEATSAALVHSDLVRAGSALYLVQHNNVLQPTQHTQIKAISTQNGATLWMAESNDPQISPVRESPANRVAANADSVVLATSWNRRLRVQRFEASTGFRAQEGYLACSDDCAQPQGVALDASGNARAALTLSDTAVGTTAAVLTLPGALRNIRIDQPGIAGAWWSPYANGEGLVIDYLPASRTFFAPWFTFSRNGGNDPAGQRWYVVQGSVPANATSVELPITESAGGNFDAGPTVQARIVGKATLNFTDCNNGTMRYAFDAATNGAAEGTITLSRLVPASESCILADGTTQPGAGAAAPANGFDARMSGSWFEPATSGQGLQFVVQPGGVFFAPWFTFDPAGPSDDPGRQRWFTIQGNLANARSGTVEAPIVQTIGGVFDSVPTNNMTIVGKATVTFGGCDRAKVDYRFDDTESAGAMRALIGSIDLVKIGGCAAR